MSILFYTAGEEHKFRKEDRRFLFLFTQIFVFRAPNNLLHPANCNYIN